MKHTAGMELTHKKYRWYTVILDQKVKEGWRCNETSVGKPLSRNEGWVTCVITSEDLSKNYV